MAQSIFSIETAWFTVWCRVWHWSLSNLPLNHLMPIREIEFCCKHFWVWRCNASNRCTPMQPTFPISLQHRPSQSSPNWKVNGVLMHFPYSQLSVSRLWAWIPPNRSVLNAIVCVPLLLMYEFCLTMAINSFHHLWISHFSGHLPAGTTTIESEFYVTDGANSSCPNVNCKPIRWLKLFSTQNLYAKKIVVCSLRWIHATWPSRWNEFVWGGINTAIYDQYSNLRANYKRRTNLMPTQSN